MTKEDTNAVIERVGEYLAKFPVEALYDALHVDGSKSPTVADLRELIRLARIGVSLEGEVASSDKSEQNKA